MELKDVVLSVLSDIQEEEESRLIDLKREESAKVRETREEEPAKAEPIKAEAPKAVVKAPKPAPIPVVPKPAAVRPRISEEEQFLRNMKERILVMFEGFNSPKNQSVEAKVDLTINFLEYLLSVTDERLDAINAAKK